MNWNTHKKGNGTHKKEHSSKGNGDTFFGMTALFPLLPLRCALALEAVSFFVGFSFSSMDHSFAPSPGLRPPP